MNISLEYARCTNNYGGGASSQAMCGLPAIFTGRPHSRWLCTMREPLHRALRLCQANSSWFVCRLRESKSNQEIYFRLAARCILRIWFYGFNLHEERMVTAQLWQHTHCNIYCRLSQGKLNGLFIYMCTANMFSAGIFLLWMELVLLNI